MNEPVTPSIQVINFLNTKVQNPTTYSKAMASCHAQRSVLVDPRLSMLKIDHLYYGNIRMWASIADSKISQV